jgi:hypothetical protein
MRSAGMWWDRFQLDKVVVSCRRVILREPTHMFMSCAFRYWIPLIRYPHIATGSAIVCDNTQLDHPQYAGRPVKLSYHKSDVTVVCWQYTAVTDAGKPFGKPDHPLSLAHSSTK